jgi:diguanylate cyclase (GGDEF)-like protein
MILRIFLIVLEVLFITVLDYYMASSFYSLDVLYCLPVIQTARLGALQQQRNSDSHSLYIVAAFCALAWSLAEAAVTWPGFPISAFLMNVVTRSVTFTIIGRVIMKIRKDKQYARKDWLTGLPDRTEFIKWFEIKQDQSERSGLPYSLIMINIDGFRAFNDKHGYQLGDQALVLMANTLLENSRGEDTASRLGSDEFLLLLSDTDEKACDFMTGRIVNAAVSSFQKNGWDLSLSCGKATETGVTRSVDELLRAATDSMRLDKEARKQNAADLGWNRTVTSNA